MTMIISISTAGFAASIDNTKPKVTKVDTTKYQVITPEESPLPLRKR